MSKDDIWSGYAKGVRPLKPAKPKASLKKSTSLVTPKARQVAVTPTIDALLKSVSPATFKQSWDALLDKRLERDLRAGDVDIDARLDLHGMTQVEAHAALGKFLATQVKRGARVLLIITGRGGILKGGVLRSNLRMWLENLPEAERILRLTQAAVKHGGAGAFYVVLRRSAKGRT